MSILDIEQKIDTHWLELLGFQKINSARLNMWTKCVLVNVSFDYPYEYEKIRRKLNFVLTYDITDRGNSLGYRLMSQLNGYEDRYEHHCGIEFNLSDKDVIAFVKGFPEYIKQRITIKDPHLFYERDERIRC